MNNSIAIVDYGMGNLSSVKNALDHIGQPSHLVSRAEELKDAPTIILPGVGAFGQAMENLRSLHFVETLTEEVVRKGKWFLGICLGMQLIGEDSEELGFHKGLGWLEGSVKKLDVPDALHLPHIGWNDLDIHEASPLFEGIASDKNFYFVHTFHLMCPGKYIIAHSHYGIPFAAAVRKENIFATQFHPEKSHDNGLLVLKNFVAYVNACHAKA